MKDEAKPETGIQVPGAELESFAGRLRSCTKGRSARSIAREAGVSETVFRKYAAGQSEPTRPALIGLAGATKVRLEWLAMGVGPMLAGGDGVSETARTAYGAPSARAPDADRLAEAIALIDQGLARTRRNPSPVAKARLVVLAYEALEPGDLSKSLRAFVQALIELTDAPSNEP